MKSHPVYIIAEAGVNHNGKRELAFQLIDVAANSGADAVKFQTFDADKLAALSAPKAAYQKRNTDAGQSQHEMLKALELPKAWHKDLQQYAHERGIEFLSTPFEVSSLRFLVELGLPILKVPSGELTNGPLLWQFAHTRKPLILSTGMSTLSEVEQGLAIVAHGLHHAHEPSSMDQVWLHWSQESSRSSLKGHVTLLHCTSQYPTPMHEVNLAAMQTLANAFGLQVGYSDHTEGCAVALAAVALGASCIEKHFTLDRNLPGPDHGASLIPQELAQMVRDIRFLQNALGDSLKAPQPSEWNTREAARQQVIAARNIPAGALIKREDLTTARCGRGMPACTLWELIGKRSNIAYAQGDVLEP